MTSPSDPAKPPAAPPTTREIATPDPRRTKGLGKKYIAVIGIDRYRSWGALGNAVQDARGAQQAFIELGFQPARQPLLDDDATGAALHRLVTDELAWLGTDDSLVVFFAGHGHTVTTTFGDGSLIKKGYLIPVDADSRPSQTSGWLSLDSWLGAITLLPPRHILVILDACHSGVALDPVIRWRGADMRLAEPIEALRARRSRRIITSALDDQLAMDSGPITGHSLFTGCLIEALTGGLLAKTGQLRTTGSELGIHVQQRVSSYPSSSQTPDFGALQLDSRGELIIDLPPPPGAVTHGDQTIVSTKATSVSVVLPNRRDAAPVGIDSITSTRAPRTPVTPPEPRTATQVSGPDVVVSSPPPPIERSHAEERPGEAVRPPSTPPLRSGPPKLDAAFVAALERHVAVRKRGASVLSIVTADPVTAAAGWATWAAARGELTLVSQETGLDATIDALLAQMPWLRAVPAARRRLARTAGLEVNALDAALDSRTPNDREAWIDHVARHDLHARVSGWLLSSLRDPWSQLSDLKRAPVQGGDLLSILCDLAMPFTVLLHHASPTAAWLDQAVQTAAALVDLLPRHAVALGAPSDLVEHALRAHSGSAAIALARQGMVPLASRSARPSEHVRSPAEETLYTALSSDPRTSGLFEANAQIPIHDRERAIVVDLVARDALLAIEIDHWYQFRDPTAYHRDRIKDVWLQRAGFFVMRFLLEDIEDRIAQTVDEVATGLACRRASGFFVEKSQ